MEARINVIAKDGLARIGNDIIQLVDESASTYHTDNVSDFRKFLSENPRKKGVLFYNECKVTSVSQGPKWNTVPDAVLTLKNSTILSRLISTHQKKISLKEFELFLLAFRNYTGSVELSLLSQLKDWRVSKMTEIIRSKDKKGNYTYLVKREDGNGGFDPPEQITITIPIFGHIDHDACFIFDLFFDFEERNGEVTTYFQIMNYTFDDELFQHRKRILESELASILCPQYWGEDELVRTNDLWKYQSNGVNGEINAKS